MDHQSGGFTEDISVFLLTLHSHLSTLRYKDQKNLIKLLPSCLFKSMWRAIT